MKLLYCTGCQDLFKLDYKFKSCKCGKSGGCYKKDGLHAVMRGPCVPLGIDNTSLAMALDNRPEGGLGRYFLAFVIPEHCDTVEV